MAMSLLCSEVCRNIYKQSMERLNGECPTAFLVGLLLPGIVISVAFCNKMVPVVFQHLQLF